MLESTLVNQNLPKQFQTNTKSLLGGGELNLAMYEDKRHKADYISLQLAFMNDLTNLSLRLKDPRTGKDKDNFLFKELRRINDWIDANVRSEAHKVKLPDTRSKFKGGIVFPMKIGDDRDPFVILGNIPELSAVFETKARAPYKIVFEVCRLSELIEETLAEEKANLALEAGAAATDLAEAQANEERTVKNPDDDSEADRDVWDDDEGAEDEKAVIDTPAV